MPFIFANLLCSSYFLKKKDGGKEGKLIPYSISNIGKGKECCLAIDFEANIVVEWVVFERNDQNEKIHNIALGAKNVLVSIKMLLMLVRSYQYLVQMK